MVKRNQIPRLLDALPHLGFAVLLLVCLSSFCFALFSEPTPTPAPAYATAAAATLDVLEDVVVVDGDTVRADIYLGRGVLLRRQRVRLEGFDAWESNRIRFRDKTTADELRKGKLATEALAKLIRESEIQLLSDGGRGPHGRPVGRLRLIQRDGSVVNVERTMIAAGHDRRMDRLGHER